MLLAKAVGLLRQHTPTNHHDAVILTHKDESFKLWSVEVDAHHTPDETRIEVTVLGTSYQGSHVGLSRAILTEAGVEPLHPTDYTSLFRLITQGLVITEDTTGAIWKEYCKRKGLTHSGVIPTIKPIRGYTNAYKDKNPWAGTPISRDLNPIITSMDRILDGLQYGEQSLNELKSSRGLGDGGSDRG